MNIWILYLLKSTSILSILYLVFRLLIRKETFFLQSRIVIVLIILFATIIPLVNIPGTPSFVPDNHGRSLLNYMTEEPRPVDEEKRTAFAMSSSAIPQNNRSIFITTEELILSIHVAGALIALCLFCLRLSAVYRVIKKSQIRTMDGFRLIVVNNDIPAFSFGKYIVISKNDYATNSEAILTHELSHIKHGHFYDLLLMELVKIIHWFNPLVYMMNSDMKEIHEYQADEFTINSGVDAAGYQLLLIQKSVGSKKFTLANTFNHCQIKNRITMMNKSKNRKSWNWKVATFLPLLVILLLSFGKKGEYPTESTDVATNLPTENSVLPPEKAQKQYEQFKQKIEIRKDGNYIDNKPVTLEEIKDQDRRWRDASNAWIFLLIDESIPNNRIDEVRESLIGNYWVVQATVGSDDFVYFAGDVSKIAEFKQGNWSDWLKNQLKNYADENAISLSRNYRLSYSFIIEKDGRVRDGHVIEECEYPEINKAYNKILSNIPDWEPAKRLNETVSVYWKRACINSIN